MKKALLTGERRFEIVDAPVPDVGPDEVLVRVAACGVCASELDMWSGVAGATFPMAPGHEATGTVEALGSEVVGLRVGEAVAVWVTTGGFGEFVAVKEAYCHPVGDIPLTLALGEPVACAVNAVDLARVRLGDEVLVVGGGFMGNLVQELVALSGASRVIVADTRQDALERARTLGADRVVDVTREPIVDVVSDLTGGKGVDISFEVTGVQQPLSWLGDVTRMSGKIAIAGYHQGPPRSLPLAQWNYMAFDIVNCHFREVSVINEGIARGMRLLSSGRLSMEPLVTHFFDLEDIDKAFQTLEDKPEGFVKANVLIGAAGER
ncbi:alcohol dehydrogenase catalytic domain-containing protein [Pedococcus sp. 5OH_020]|uniref:alcohol dehydrogenase catalytic domain-containing protein n=1 Tax=Pedococcus sp. 5OH_020 TaxID=2989814 RepID=UPI0022E9C44C|nr:zinc-binding dehydrogenase [Pedococcus sp. 5OH_020]